MNTTDANQKLHEVAKGVAQCMDGWQYADEQHEHRALLDGPNGEGINVAWKGFDHERLAVYGRWPEQVRHRDLRVYEFYPYSERPTISVSASRAPGSIAKDIQRRLLPEYLPLWQEAVGRRQAKIAELEKLDEMLAQLTQIPGVQEDKNKEGVRFGRHDTVHGDADVHNNETMSLTIHNLPFAVACEVLERVLS